eukprot:TRINITY_DN55015_c0_g1_i1.p1 TRINITY_DN55015_c0_g1~~TRINITY_DN55015_c0_g1_i1.p1  ORF type:complete len:279 (-),score=32.32 TRINITY_DN55015_c0_g1_i1:69-905(-)
MFVGSVVNFLQHHHGVDSVQYKERGGCSIQALTRWEASHNQKLPDDAKSFFMTSDGFSLKWSIRLGTESVPLGHMNINPLVNVTRLEPDSESSEEEAKRCRNTYVLDASPSTAGKVVLHYKQPTTPEICFISLDNTWHFVSASFENFMRLLLMHLGLPAWLCIFTPSGLPPVTAQWFRFLIPERFAIENSAKKEVQTNKRGGYTAGTHKQQPSQAKKQPPGLDLQKLVQVEKSAKEKEKHSHHHGHGRSTQHQQNLSTTPKVSTYNMPTRASSSHSKR